MRTVVHIMGVWIHDVLYVNGVPDPRMQHIGREEGGNHNQ